MAGDVVVEDLRARMRELERELGRVSQRVAAVEGRVLVGESRLDGHDKQFDNLRAEKAHFPQVASIIISSVIAALAAIASWYGAGLLGP